MVKNSQMYEESIVVVEYIRELCYERKISSKRGNKTVNISILYVKPYDIKKTSRKIIKIIK